MRGKNARITLYAERRSGLVFLEGSVVGEIGILIKMTFLQDLSRPGSRWVGLQRGEGDIGPEMDAV
jgi:hypothetical protein